MVSEHASPLAALGGVDAGGQNVHVAALSAALARRGHRVTVYTRRDSTKLAARVKVMRGFEVVHVDAGPPCHVPKDELLPYMGELAEGMVRDWAAGVPDIVHAHFWMSGLAALKAVHREFAFQGADGTRGTPLPVVQTFHALGTVKRRYQGSSDTSPVERRHLEPLVGRSVDRILATCPDEVLELKAMGIDPLKVSVAPCGVDLARFTPEGEVEARNRSHRILSVGRLVPRKGVDLVIQSLSILRDSGIGDVELVIAGGGAEGEDSAMDPEARRLQDAAERYGVRDQVTFRGQMSRDAMPALFRSADVVACTPWYEPFGIVPLEAMACGIPVVAAAVGGLQDSVVHGETGLHVPPKDPQAIASAIHSLLTNPAFARKLGKAGRKRAQSRFSWELVAAESEKAYLLAIRKTLGAAEAAVMQGAAS
ncbi:glycosyltransferase involved in cell wall biosynthesis [Arthrobacter bambusae]|nr:glycosyltransferase involved in cell wall biosynthesis [Arthrobacter bambusae]